MKQILLQFKQSLALAVIVLLPAFLLSCAGGGERSPISKPVGQLRSVPLKSGQVWSGSFDPDGKGNGGTFSMLISDVDSQGNFNGYMKAGLLLTGTGRISGNVTGSNIKFTLQHAANTSYFEYYNGSYSDQLRGRYQTRTHKSSKGAFSLSESLTNQNGFMASYDRIVMDEKSTLVKSEQARKTTVVYRDSPSYNTAPQQSYSDFTNQQRQEDYMRRQTEAMEQMQRDSSWNNFEQNQRALFER
jgi:hypothetical protein